MRSIGRSTTLAALLSGALSEVLYRLCDDRRAPLLMSALVALVAAGLTVSTADAPVLGEAPLCGGDAEAGLGRFFEFPRDTSGGRSVRGAVVTAGAAIVDAAAAIALVAWAPTVSRADPDAPFGFVFSLTMAAAVAGTQVFGAVAASSKRFEPLAAACCATGGLAFAFLATQPAGLGAALAPFLAFQLALSLDNAPLLRDQRARCRERLRDERRVVVQSRRAISRRVAVRLRPRPRTQRRRRPGRVRRRRGGAGRDGIGRLQVHGCRIRHAPRLMFDVKSVFLVSTLVFLY